MKDKRCFIIAEAGVNHNGSIDTALEMVKIAALSGADAVKFQTFNAEKLATKTAHTAQYQKENTGLDTQQNMLKMLQLSQSDFLRLFEESKRQNIEFMSTPFDLESLDFLVSLGMKRIKIPSGELTNIPFIKNAASKNLPIILSTGMGTMTEIEEAVSAVYEVQNSSGLNPPGLTIMHCTSSYPTQPEDANLNAIFSIRKTFSLPVGFSDHTLGVDAAFVCIGIGVSVYEKHFTLDKNLNGPDHKMSLSPQELNQLVKNIRLAETYMGSGEKKPTPSEKETIKLVRRSIAVNKNKKLGDVIFPEDVQFLRPGTGIEPKYVDSIINKRLKKNLLDGDLISWEDIE